MGSEDDARRPRRDPRAAWKRVGVVAVVLCCCVAAAGPGHGWVDELRGWGSPRDVVDSSCPRTPPEMLVYVVDRLEAHGVPYFLHWGT